MSKLPTDGKKFHPKSAKTKDYEEIIKYAEMGIYDEDNRPYDPMEVDHVLVNHLRRIEGTSPKIVNAT
jgi:hypothetical protein